MWIDDTIYYIKDYIFVSMNADIKRNHQISANIEDAVIFDSAYVAGIIADVFSMGVYVYKIGGEN
jgi:hypothetical protein